MPYTPYTLQTLLPSVLAEDPSASHHQQQQPPQPPTPSSSSPIGSPPTLFSRRSPPSSISDVNRSFSSSPSRFNGLLSGHTSTPAFAVDAVEAWDTNLYIGTSDGHVFHYTLEEGSNPSDQKSNVPHVSRLEHKINLGFGRKSVERILVIPQVSKAVVLCDSTLSFYSLPFFDPIPVSVIPHIKGVSCFAHDIAQEGRIGEDGTVELCVVKRRVIQIYKIGELVQKEKELPLPDGAITLAWHGRNICLADFQNYKLINLQLSNATPLIPIPQLPASPPSASSMLSSSPQLVPRPVLAVIKQDEFLVVTGSVNNQTIGLFVNTYGDAVRGTLQWSSYPKSLCVEFPYIATLLRNHTIEIHNVLDQKLLQVITLEPQFEARGMSFGHGIKVWMDGLARRLTRRPWPTDIGSEDDEDLNYNLRRQVARYSAMPARILVYGRDTVMAQLVKPLIVQVDEMLDNNRVEEALEMADQARNAMSTDNNIHIERLRCELDFIYQKAGLLLLKETLFDDAFSLLSKGDLDPRVVIQLFADLSQPKWLQEQPRILLFEGVRSIYESIGHIENLVTRGNGENESTKELQRVFMANAREALQKYLTIERGKLRDKIGQGTTVCKAIDTALLKLYVYNNNDNILHRMLQRPNDCCLQECSDTLKKFKKYYALSLLYQSKRAYEQVLETWTEMYSKGISDPNFNGLQQIKQLLLQDISPEYLNQSVIVRYAWWLTEQSTNDGVEIFIRSPRATELDSHEILDKLEQYGDAAVRKYLEYLVLTRQSKESEHHTRLACSYVRDVQRELEGGGNGKQRLQALVDEYKQETTNLGVTDGQPFVRFLGTHEASELVLRRLKLIRLLQRSPLYTPERLLEAIKEAGPLDIEMVIVYGRMKRHREALDILIKDISDYGGAETYCVTNGQSTGAVPEIMVPPARSSSLQNTSKRKKLKKKKEKEPEISGQHLQERRELFSILLRLYLELGDSQLCLNRTMHLLATQGYYLDIMEVLDLIPDDWPIQMLQDFLIRSLRRSLHSYKNGQVVLGISRGENLKVGSELIDLYKDIGPVQVNVDTVCQRCHRYLGDCIVVREPRNGDLLHLECAQKLGLIKDGNNTSINET